MSAELSISEVAELAGLKASALRYYERQELLAPIGRRQGRRVYDRGVLRRLGFIRLAQAAGFSIAEIRTLLYGFPRRTPPRERWRALADAKRRELDEAIASAEARKQVLEKLVGCECPTPEHCGSGASARAGDAERS
jgi:MerR family redox-sensitive transcriptional activator SoxR